MDGRRYESGTTALAHDTAVRRPAHATAAPRNAERAHGGGESCEHRGRDRAAQRRFAMSGTESWRDKTEKVPAELTLESAAAEVAEMEREAAAPLSIDTDMLQAVSEGVDEMDVVSPSSLATPPSDALLEIEQEILNPKSPAAQQKTLKRSLDVHAPTRFAHEGLDRPVKLAKTDEKEKETTPTARLTATAAPAVESPRATSFLDILKQQQQSQEEVKTHHTAHKPKPLAVPSAAPAGFAGMPSPGRGTVLPPSMRLIGKDGVEVFSITRPGGVVVQATGLISDRRLQGLIKPTFNIDGRSKIADLDRSEREML